MSKNQKLVDMRFPVKYIQSEIAVRSGKVTLEVEVKDEDTNSLTDGRGGRKTVHGHNTGRI